jgi:ribosomal protein L11 methylase PrmA
MWRYLFDEQLGAHQRCLDMGSGTGVQTVQLALNGAAHVHAIDVDERAVTDTLESAFENGVADRVSAEVGDLYPWVAEERCPSCPLTGQPTIGAGGSSTR